MPKNKPVKIFKPKFDIGGIVDNAKSKAQETWDIIHGEADRELDKFKSRVDDMRILKGENVIKFKDPSDEKILLDGRSMADKFYNETYGAATKTLRVGADIKRSITLRKDLWMINALPPMPDNVVDPPVILTEDDIKTDITTWVGGVEGLVGKDYIARVLARGQFLSLVPLELKPSLAGAIKDMAYTLGAKVNVNSFINKWSTLTEVTDRLNNTGYGYVASVNSLKYWRTVQAIYKVAMLALGIDNIKNISEDYLKRFLPDEIVDKMYGENLTSKANPFEVISADKDPDGGGEGSGYTPQDRELAIAESYQKEVEMEVRSVTDFKLTEMAEGNSALGSLAKSAEEISKIARNSSIMNMMKFITGVDESDSINATLPFVIFYCNGPIERSFASSLSLEESSVIKHTTDIGQTAVQAGAKVAHIDGLTSSGQDVMSELAYHNSMFATGFSFLVSNTKVPRVIKDAMLDMQYTVSVREIVLSSDRFSISRLFWTLAQLLPFVTPVNEPGSAMIVPSSPMYVSAFSKGIMNLPRAAITSLSIKTDSAMQTTEGIPTELDIQFTIQPWISVGTIPNFGKWYNPTSSTISLAASAFNPLSAFNIIATLAGQNTVLTKFNMGILEFMVKGVAENVYNSIKGTADYATSNLKDWRADASTRYGQTASTRTIFNLR